MPKPTDAYLRLNLAVLIASGTGLFGRLITIGELPLVMFRVIIGALLLALVMGVRHQLKKISRHDLLQIIGCGILLSVHWVFFYGSIKAANVSIGAVCFALVGFFTAIMEPLINHHRPSWREMMLSALSAIGIALIFGLETRYRTGIILGIVSSILYTLFSICSKKVQATSGQSSSTMLLYELLGGAIILPLVLPLYSHLFPATGILPAGNDLWLMLIFASVFTVVPFLLQLQALRHISAFTVNLTYNLEPVYTILLATIIFNEAAELNLAFWAGITLILTSVILQTIASKKQPKTT